MASSLDGGYQGVYIFFLVVSLVLMLSAASLPTWFNSDTSNGSCGPITSPYVWEYEVEYWKYSAVALCISVVLILASTLGAISPCCCCTFYLNALIYALTGAVLFAILGIVLFSAGFPDTSLQDDSNDEPVNPEVFMRACAAVTTTICAVMEWLLRDARSRRIHPLDDEDRMFYE
ncbi:hypothetical protein PTSG_07065 [Salpingoeca rosetta]|uniref:Uncharacterized protein n=1 Tax=Salpingoeca rosetta (strain ATCC 50818 / BSB-021) TaxID=946362 RepID=F2UDY5_SALR5|nr:uncharacterized protein PTSG_07065 [Salpingoeca rosetta]EGD74835.1 hypothetical protein PTSG_07065 [Salpingoeca rosetta]|eukprot:XP_004992480.1 hypothetical protein PTSG_07065 [Salpingoeca rosetta]